MSLNGISHKYQIIYNKPFLLLVIDSLEYFIGIEIANFLQKETFNLYTSLKIRNIPYFKAQSEHIEYINRNGLLKAIHSFTLIPYYIGLTLITRYHKQKYNYFLWESLISAVEEEIEKLS
jgi:hypothetical protein